MREPGSEIHGRYTLVRMLGTGMGGETWLARDRAGSELAIKLLASESSQARSDLLREAQVLQGIVHQHVVRYRGIVDFPGDDTCLFMDFVPGGDLQDHLRKTHPSGYTIRAASELWLQVLEALDALHVAGVLHRDLKPKNILVADADSNPPRLLVADFGISKQTAGGGTGETRPVGTPGYMAPEQYRSRTLSFAADLHALGGIGWFLATGTHPPDAGDRAPVQARREAAQSGRERAYWDLVVRLRHSEPGSRGTLVEARKVLVAITGVGEWTDEPADGRTVDLTTLEAGNPTLNTADRTPQMETTLRKDAPESSRFGLPAWAWAGGGAIAALLMVGLAIQFWPRGTGPDVRDTGIAGVDTPPVVETLPVENPVGPVVISEVVETPVVETPVVETPVVETPVVETPPVETPVLHPSGGVTGSGYSGGTVADSAPVGHLTVYVSGAGTKGVRVRIDEDLVAACTDCRGPMVLRRHDVAPGRHSVVCEGPEGRDLEPNLVEVSTGGSEDVWCAPTY